MSQAKSAVVVGAGVAGLTAAHRLQRANIPTVVLEAAEQVGGRLHTVRRDGFTIDLGAQVVYSSYRTTMALCRELGLGDQLQRLRTTARILRHDRLHSQLALLDSWRKRLKIVGLQLALRFRRRNQSETTGAEDPLADVDFETYVRGRFGQELLDELFEPFVAALTHGRARDISAACGLEYVGWGLGRTYGLRGGLGTLTTTLAAGLSDVRRGHSVAEVLVSDGRVVGLRCAAAPAGFIESENVILAVPAFVASTLVRASLPAVVPLLDSVRYSQSVHVVLALSRPATRNVYAIVIPREETLHSTCVLEDAARGSSTTPKGRGLVHFLMTGRKAEWAASRTDAEVIEAALQDLRLILPNAPRSYRFGIVRRWPASVCLWGRGYGSIARSVLTEARTIQGIDFAGDYLRIPSVEGAAASGAAAADRVIRAMRSQSARVA